MPFNKILGKDFYIKDNVIILDQDYFNNNLFKFKKITGSRLVSVLNKNSFCSPFKLWTIMVGLYQEKMDETLAYVGNTIEPKLKRYLELQTNIKFMQYNPKSVGFDIFKNNKIFGGVPDGEPLNSNNEIDYSTNLPMLEIKTTSYDSLLYKSDGNVLRMKKSENNFPIVKAKKDKYNKWHNNDKLVIPEEYKLQLSLYLYLRNVNHGLFMIAFLKPEDYVYPEKFDPEKAIIEFATLDFKKESFLPIIKKAEQWYNEHILTGKSPKMTDADWKWVKQELKLNNQELN